MEDNKVTPKKGVIILHQFPRTSKAPSPSPYPIKVETFLRMNKIEYTSDFKDFMGPKGKCPWITDDDSKPVSDSQFIIEHLIKKHNITKMNDLSPENAAIERSMRCMIEDNIYFVVVAMNYVYGSVDMLMKIYPRFVPAAAPNFLQRFIVKRIKGNLSKQAIAQGIGRHSKEEVEEIGRKDIEALSAWLGSKPYMMGNDPYPLDCTAFGFLAVCLYTFPEDHVLRKQIEASSNLKAYVERIKEAFWPDWDEILVKPN